MQKSDVDGMLTYSGMADHIELQTATEAPQDEVIPADEVRNPLDIDIANPKLEMMRDETIQKSSSKCGLDSLCCKYYWWCMKRAQYVEAANAVSPPSGLYNNRGGIRQCHSLFIAIFVIVFAQSDVLGLPNWMPIIFFSGNLIFSIVIFAYAACAKGKESFFEKLNAAFGIPNPVDPNSIEALFDTDRRMWGMCFMTCVTAITINNLISYLFFASTTDASWDECLDHDEDSRYWNDPEFRGRCVVNASQIAQIYVLAIAVFVMCSSYYRVNGKYVEMMDNYLINDQNNLTQKVKEIKDDIQNRLKVKWKESKSLSGRSAEVIITFIMAISFHVGSYGVVRNELFSGGISLGAVIFTMYIYFVEASILTWIVHYLFELLYHYPFGRFILNLLSHQFNAESMEDIVSWWELRKYYLDCIIDIYASGITGWIGGMLLGALLLIPIGFGFDQFSETSESTVVYVFIGYGMALLIYATLLTSVAVDIYNAQLTHVNTLRKEKMRLEYKGYDQHESVYEKIVEDVTENVMALKVFGIKMRPEFLILLQSSATAVFMAAIFGG